MGHKYLSLDNIWTPERIMALRKMLGMTQEEFAQEIGASPRTVKAWEYGELCPNGTAHKLFDLMYRDAKMRRAVLKEEQSQTED
jgi:putative transcriptional regulator